MRQLAAILFADMTGYTAVMQENEQLARTRRRRLKEVLDISIPRFNGKVLQFYGDGSLSIFSSAIDSVWSAIAIQQILQEEPVVPVRIGIHIGDVNIEEEAIYGDGVNLASRIESLAVPGGILVSEKVFDEIRNQENILTREMGYFEFKNVKQPLRIFAIANHGIAVPARQELGGKTQLTRNRLAVLPFVNMSPDPDNEYFSDGITEELLNALAKVDELKVTSRTSAFAFKGKNEDIRDIAIQLNVDKVLEGSVRRSGNRVRITTQLINAADGYHLWSEVYDRDLTDIFAVQDEISGIIANKLRENLSADQKREPLVKAATKNITAYTYYLKGLHYWNKITPADVMKAIEFYERAIAIEPTYAHAYAMAASAYSMMGSRGQMIPAKAFEVVHRYADKAMALDDTIAESYIAKANAYLLYDWKWKEAYEALQKALDLNPAATEAYQLLGFYNIVIGEKEKAVQLLEQAEQIDPLSPAVTLTLGSMYTFAYRFDDAIKQAEKLLEINPHMRSAIEMKGWANGLKGNWAEALLLFKEVHRLTNHPLKGLMGLAFAYGILGQREEALTCIQKMDQLQREEPTAVIDIDIAIAWLGLGDLEKHFYYVNQCIDKRIGPLSYFLEYPGVRWY
jgi:TolB-like protein/class 3 adenylate cyclase/Flp pilus assembly protein TadD